MGRISLDAFRSEFLEMGRKAAGKAARALLFSSAIAIAAATGCATPVKSDGIPPIRDVLRDWRGVWSGSVSDSPLGPFDYTLHITQEGKNGDVIHLKMANGDEAPEPVRSEFALMNFDEEKPRLRALVAFRSKTITRDYVYSPNRSTRSHASFCLKDRGCTFGEITFETGKRATVRLRAFVNEAPYAALSVQFVQRDIPEKKKRRVEKSEVVTKRDTRITDGSVPIESYGTTPNSADSFVPEQEEVNGSDDWE